MKTLLLDIETTPNSAWVWDLWNQNVALSQLITSSQMLCFVSMWYDPDNTVPIFYSEWEHTWEGMVWNAWQLLDEADAVVTYNGARFDIPVLNKEFLAYGLGPPSPFKQIDLYKTVKRNFKLPSMKLQYVAEFLELDGKVEHSGFSLWTAVMRGDEEAQTMMKKYNIRDVTLLAEVYEKLLPWITDHPNVNLYSDSPEDGGCPRCGEPSLLQKRGFSYTATGRYQRYCCGGCGSWSKSSHRDAGTGISGVKL